MADRKKTRPSSARDKNKNMSEPQDIMCTECKQTVSDSDKALECQIYANDRFMQPVKKFTIYCITN